MKKSERKRLLLAKFPSKYAPRVAKITRSGRPSMRAAIDLFCVECMGCQNGAPRMIRECTSKLCPLFDLRPFQERPSAADSDLESTQNENVT